MSSKATILESLHAMMGRELYPHERRMIDAVFDRVDPVESPRVNPDSQKRVIWAHHSSTAIH